MERGFDINIPGDSSSGGSSNLLSSHYKLPLNNLEELRNIPFGSLVDKERHYVESEKLDYFWDSTAVSGAEVCNDNTGSVGFWVKSSVGGSNGFPTQSFTAVLENGDSLGTVKNGNTVPVFNTPDEMLTFLGVTLLLPTIISYNGISLSGANSIVEVGVLLNNTLSAVFNRGLINNRNNAPNTFLTGASTSRVFNGLGIDPNTGVLNIAAPEGTTTWSVVENYSEGTDLYYDSNGDEADNLDSSRAAGSVSDTLSRTAIYPFFYGMNSNNLLSGGSTFYNANLTKLIQSKNNKSLNINGLNEYIYYAYPSSYGDLDSIIDGNGFDVTSSFSKTTVNIESTGLSNNYNESYNIYRTISVTTVSNQIFKFNF